jgi:hypothetical protein
MHHVSMMWRQFQLQRDSFSFSGTVSASAAGLAYSVSAASRLKSVLIPEIRQAAGGDSATVGSRRRGGGPPPRRLPPLKRPKLGV